jgi:hypothetical protein
MQLVRRERSRWKTNSRRTLEISRASLTHSMELSRDELRQSHYQDISTATIATDQISGEAGR